MEAERTAAVGEAVAPAVAEGLAAERAGAKAAMWETAAAASWEAAMREAAMWEAAMWETAPAAAAAGSCQSQHRLSLSRRRSESGQARLACSRAHPQALPVAR